jgi:hypothetical protein
MDKLTRAMVLAKSRETDLEEVTHLNAWGLGLRDVSVVSCLPSAEVLSLSINEIESLEPFSRCLNLRELYLRRNKIKSWDQLKFLEKLPKLEILWLLDNPVAAAGAQYRMEVLSRLHHLKTLDHEDVTDEERARARAWSEHGTKQSAVQGRTGRTPPLPRRASHCKHPVTRSPAKDISEEKVEAVDLTSDSPPKRPIRPSIQAILTLLRDVQSSDELAMLRRAMHAVSTRLKASTDPC